MSVAQMHESLTGFVVRNATVENYEVAKEALVDLPAGAEVIKPGEGEYHSTSTKRDAGDWLCECGTTESLFAFTQFTDTYFLLNPEILGDFLSDDLSDWEREMLLGGYEEPLEVGDIVTFVGRGAEALGFDKLLARIDLLGKGERFGLTPLTERPDGFRFSRFSWARGGVVKAEHPAEGELAVGDTVFIDWFDTEWTGLGTVIEVRAMGWGTDYVVDTPRVYGVVHFNRHSLYLIEKGPTPQKAANEARLAELDSLPDGSLISMQPSTDFGWNALRIKQSGQWYSASKRLVATTKPDSNWTTATRLQVLEQGRAFEVLYKP